MSRVGSGMGLGQSRDQTISSPVLPSLSDPRVGHLVGGSPIPEVGEARPAWGTPAHVCLCGCWVHASGISAWLPGLLLGGEEQEGELHKGKLVGGPCCFRGSLPSREGQGAPRFPGRNHTLLPAVCCPLSPATGVVVASPHSSCHPVCLGPSTPEDSSFQQPSVCSLPMGSLPK